MIQRQPLRDQVRKEILARLDDGRLAPGTRVNETHLASDLGISRTPLREALLQLEASGFLDSDMGRGWLVPALDPAVFTASLEVLARLEPLALGLTMPLPGQRVMELNNLMGRCKLQLGNPGPATAPALCALVSGWAHLLLETCPNRVLLDDVMRLEAVCRRYWFAAAVGGFPASVLITGLEAMYDLVRTGQSARAATQWSEIILGAGPVAARHLTAADAHVPGR